MIEVMKQALEALESCTPQDTSTGHVIYAWHDEELVNKSITSLRQAISELEQRSIAELESQEPVDYEKLAALGWQAIECGICGCGAMGYPQRTWVGLTDSQRKEIERQSVYVDGAIRMTEAKLKENNI